MGIARCPETARFRPAGIGRALSVIASCACAAVVLTPAAAAETRPTLTSDAAGHPLFDASITWLPGDSHAACLQVTAAGAGVADRVWFAVTDLSGDLAPWLALRVDVGTGGRYGDCTGFTGRTVYQGNLSALSRPSAGNGAVGADVAWRPGRDGARHTFRLTVSLAAVPQALGRTSRASFLWRLCAGDGLTDGPTDGKGDGKGDGAADGKGDGKGDGAPDDPTQGPTDGSSTAPAPVYSTSVPEPAHVPPASSATGPTASLLIPGTGPGAGPGPARRSVVRRLLERIPPEAVDTLRRVADRPAFSAGPLAAALLFLLSQHLVDLRDPKLVAACRTRRELLLAFPRRYVRTGHDGAGERG